MWKTLKANFNSTDSLVSLALGLAVVLVLGMTIINYVKGRTQIATSTAKDESAKTQTTPTPGGKHTVQSGETLWSIAQSYYKSGYNWVDIQKANDLTNADVIEAGQVLTIPVVTPIVVQTGEVSSTIAPAPLAKTYTVMRGDDLWDIALKQYGSGYRWVDIAKANNLENPDIIHAGNILRMP